MEYPRMMYRDGGVDEIWGCPVESRVVLDIDQETTALMEGWRREVLTEDLPEQQQEALGIPKRRGRPPRAIAPDDEI